MKVRVLKNAGQTGFRTIGATYEVPTMRAKLLIKSGLVEDANKVSPPPEPVKKKAAPKAVKKPATKKPSKKAE